MGVSDWPSSEGASTSRRRTRRQRSGAHRLHVPLGRSLSFDFAEDAANE
jgi:hypothetical protein